MAIALWIVQGILAVMFLMAGSMKTFRNKSALRPQMPWVDDVSDVGLKLIGVSQLAAALGLILPLATGIYPWLTPVAASGLAVTMIGAIMLHARRKEPQSIVLNLVILVLALFVAYGRFVLVPAA